MSTLEVSGSKMVNGGIRCAPPNAAAISGFFNTEFVLEAGATFDETTCPSAAAVMALQCWIQS